MMNQGINPGPIRKSDKPVTCPTHGSYFPFLAIIAGKQITSKCPRCNSLKDQENLAQIIREMRSLEKTAYLRGAEIPNAYINKTLKDFKFVNATIDRALMRVKAFIEEGKRPAGRPASLIIIGKVGTGKSHLACAALNELCIAGRSGRYTTIGDIFRRIRSTWRKGSTEPEAAAYSEFTKPDFLVIDEIGIQTSVDGQASDDDLRIIADIMEKRRCNFCSTIMISNLAWATREGKPEFPLWVGERVVSRMLENGGAVLVMDGPDYRRKKS